METILIIKRKMWKGGELLFYFFGKYRLYTKNVIQVWSTQNNGFETHVYALMEKKTMYI